MNTVCQGIIDPFYIVSYYINWAKTSWIYSISNNNWEPMEPTKSVITVTKSVTKVTKSVTKVTKSVTKLQKVLQKLQKVLQKCARLYL